MNKHPLPTHWRWLLPERVRSLTFPPESRATCSSCPSKLNHYSNEAHCCAYRPQISNFLTGLALQNKAISEELFDRLKSQGAYLPLASLETPWVMDNPNLTRSAHSREEGLLVCHYWKKGVGCTVHPFRNHACATFFCFSLAGPDHGFWNELADYAMMLENNVGWWLLEKMGFDLVSFLATLQKIDENARDKPQWSGDDLALIWGPWYGKEAEFFLKCAEIVEKNKENLYEIAANFMENAGSLFLERVGAYSDYHADTHLPVAKAKILELENKMISSAKLLDQAGRVAVKSLELSMFAKILAKHQDPLLSAAYPEALCFLVLLDGRGEQVDFQPLAREEAEVFEGKVNLGLEKHRTLLGGLCLRGFLKVSLKLY